MKKCENIGQVAKYSDAWYDRKSKYDKNNESLYNYIYAMYAGIVIAILSGIVALGTSGRKKKVSAIICVVGIVIIIISGGLAASVGTKDEPIPTAAEFECVDK